MILYPAKYYEYMRKTHREDISDDEKEYWIKKAEEISKPIDDGLARYGLVA